MSHTPHNKISLSTCWLSHRHTCGYAMCCEVAELGFSFAEFSHGISPSLVPGILKAIDEGVMRASSVHNFCPLPPGVIGPAPNIYQPSSSSSKELQLWYLYTQKTLDFANRIDAPIMVAHMGSVDFFWRNPASVLDDWVEGKSVEEILGNRSLSRRISKTICSVRKKAPRALFNVQQSLQAISPYAEKYDIRIGIENRESVDELPLDGHAHELIEAYPQAGYWHDSGHAQLKQNLGLIEHRRLLELNAEHLLGFHLKDVSQDGRDNQALGSGTVDFGMIEAFIKPHHTLVIELSPRLESEEVIESRLYLEKLISPAYA